ncbi:MAG: hypothetical protein JWN48_826 [Myxococcaceae bacterium]|nr:hypothetical protein [Myxococcaceae bacterium]
MAELSIALAPLLALALLVLVATFVPLSWIGSFSLSLMVIGFVFGLPSGLYYHVLLRRELTRDGQTAPAGWYWHPQRLHERVAPEQRQNLQRWFLLGAAGFGLIVLGFLLSVLTLMLWLRAGNSLA